MDISSLYNLSSPAVSETYKSTLPSSASVSSESGDVFQSFLDSAVKNIETTNGYLSDAENEEMKLAMGETDNTHDLTIALQKASTSLQYTIAVRDKFLDAYKEIMNISI